MADDQITSITERLYIPKLIDNVFNSNAVLMRLKKGERTYDGGRTISPIIMYAKAPSVGSFTGNALLSTTIGDVMTRADFNWRQYFVTLGWTRRDFLINKSSKAQIIDLVEGITMNAAETLKDSFSTHIFQTSAGATDIDGLAVGAFAAGTTAWGGLTTSDFTAWQPGGAAAGRDTTTTTLSLSAMNVIVRQCNDGDDVISVIVTSDAIAGFLYNLLTPAQRYVDEKEGNAGFTKFSVNGIPVIVDKVSTANYVYYWNEKHLWWAAHEDENMRYKKPQEPLNQATSLGQIFWMGNIVGDSRRRQGVMTAITA